MEELSSQSFDTTAYTLASLRIISDLPLPGVMTCNGEISNGEEIVIRRSRLPKSLSSVTAEFPDGQCNENELLLNIPEAARYLIRGGTEILVEQAPASSPGSVAAYLLGTAFGVLCHQRGIIPLHASAVDVADGCVAFVGESGAGKSTLVAALASRGHQVIADDLCFLRLADTGDVKAWPGLNRIRLWEDSMLALGCYGPGVELEERGWNKYFIPVPPLRNPMQPRRLLRVYHLQAAPEDAAVISRQQGAAAIEVLIQNVYRLGLAEHMGLKPAAFVVCAALARDVPMFRFSRSLDFGILSEGVEFLENHLRDLN